VTLSSMSPRASLRIREEHVRDAVEVRDEDDVDVAPGRAAGRPWRERRDGALDAGGQRDLLAARAVLRLDRLQPEEDCWKRWLLKTPPETASSSEQRREGQRGVRGRLDLARESITSSWRPRRALPTR
jgi:hypothetical protein